MDIYTGFSVGYNSKEGEWNPLLTMSLCVLNVLIVMTCCRLIGWWAICVNKQLNIVPDNAVGKLPLPKATHEKGDSDGDDAHLSLSACLWRNGPIFLVKAPLVREEMSNWKPFKKKKKETLRAQVGSFLHGAAHAKQPARESCCKSYKSGLSAAATWDSATPTLAEVTNGGNLET